MSFEVKQFEDGNEKALPPIDLSPRPVEEKRGFLVRLIESLRVKFGMNRKGDVSFEATGGAAFLTGERRVTDDDAWREVDLRLVSALAVMVAFLAVLLAFFAVVGLAMASNWFAV